MAGEKINSKIGEEKVEQLERLVDDSSEQYKSGVLKRLISTAADIDRRESRFSDTESKIDALEKLVEGEIDGGFDPVDYDPDESRDGPLTSDQVEQIMLSQFDPTINPAHIIPESAPRSMASRGRLVAALLRYDKQKFSRKTIQRYCQKVEGDSDNIFDETIPHLWKLPNSAYDYTAKTANGAAAVSSQVDNLVDDIDFVMNGGDPTDSGNDHSKVTDGRIERVQERVQKVRNSSLDHELVDLIEQSWTEVLDYYMDEY